MKDRLLNLLSRVIELLVDCGWQEEANWFEKIRAEIDASSAGSQPFRAQLAKLDSVLAGIGSFGDLPLKSKSGNMSEQEVRELQWQLLEDLDLAITAFSPSVPGETKSTE